MILRNPTEGTIEVKIFGTDYKINPLARITVSDEVGIYWRTQLHGFLEIVTEEEKPKPVAKEVVEEKEVKTKK
jgi:hypothetical protein